MSPEQSKCFSGFLKRYSLNKYNSSYKNEPAFFFGMYSRDLRRLLRHNPEVLAVVIWRGTDILLSNHLETVMKLKNVRHVAISSFIAKDLDKKGIEYKFIPIVGSDMSGIKPCKLGDEIYAYVPKERYDFYNGKLINKLRKLCKYKINVISSFCSRKKIIKIYRKCFCGLRLTPHDGIANMVIELGLMGRKCFFNGSVPGAIPWKSTHDILKDIEEESINIGNINKKLSKEMKNYISIGDDWVYRHFWG